MLRGAVSVIVLCFLFVLMSVVYFVLLNVVCIMSRCVACCVVM